MSFDRISKRIDTYRDAMIDLQIALASIPAISPASGGLGEARKAEAILPFLRENGFANIDVLKAPDLDAPEGYRPNIIAYYRGRSSARTVWIMTHTDVVPPGETALWDGNPFRPWVKGGKIYGRGVEDNQQDLVASLFAVKAFHDEGLLPSYDVGLALVADEETGSDKGIGYVLKNSKAFRPQDIIVVPDAGNQDGTMIEIAEKSLLWLKFTTLGKQTHGSTPERGINAHRAAAFLITEIHRLYEIFPQHDPVFDPPVSTFEPTKKEANVPNINTIPGEDVFYMDSRILPSVPVDDVLARIAEMSAGIEAKFGVKVAVEYKQRADAAPPTPPDAPVVTALQKAIGDVLQRAGKPMGIGGGTVAALFRRAGFPAACWSTLDETAHQPNEYCIINNIAGDAKVFAHLMLQE